MAFSAPLGWGIKTLATVLSKHGGRGWGSGVQYSKLNGDREEVDAGLLGNLLAAGNTGEVDIAGLDEALGALHGLEKLLGEPLAKAVSKPSPMHIIKRVIKTYR